jgi:hypothetical protein
MRRTKSQIDNIKTAIYMLCEQYKPMTVRQLFYALTVKGVIEKAESEYKNVVCRLTKEMRLAGELPWDWLADHTRWQHKPRTYGGISDCLEQSQAAYRRALWDPKTNSNYVEIWLEKDALTGVFYDVTSEYDVPLMPCRGYPSLSFLRSAARVIAWRQQILMDNWLDNIFENQPKLTIYYFGDFDPTGVDISRNIEDRIRAFLSEMDDQWFDLYFEFKRVAINEDQIKDMNLQTRPTKQSDTRAKKFGHNVSVELDAIEPNKLRQMIRSCVLENIDQDELERVLQTEEAERKLLDQVLNFAELIAAK